MEQYDILIIGGGAAGISAARAAHGGKTLLVERRGRLGGILPQCAHRGFGKNQTGGEYTGSLLQDFPKSIRLALRTTALSLSGDKTALLSSREKGVYRVGFSQLILAAGCREIPMGALPIAGSRPNGVYTAGQIQEMVNIHGYIPKGPAVILGSGDIGLIMAWHLAEAGLEVTLVEKRPVCGGLTRNQRYLQTHPIRLICNATITEVHGVGELEGCTLSDGRYLPCQTLLIAAGLRPERELIHGLGEPDWLRLCGNCESVHPMVEGVVNQGIQAGKAAWESVRGVI